jgi:hypothetical protein
MGQVLVNFGAVEGSPVGNKLGLTLGCELEVVEGSPVGNALGLTLGCEPPYVLPVAISSKIFIALM